MSSNSGNFFSNLRADIPAGIVVFLVAVPLCLGIALASGAPDHAPIMSGVIAGIIGGIVVGIASGSRLGVSGPAAGLAIIVLNSIKDLGAFDIFLMAVVLAGILQIVLGFLRMGIIGYYFPSSVIKGMLAGIGILIALKQIPHAFGYDKDPIGDLAYNQVDGHNTFSEFYYMLGTISPSAIVITLLGLAILILWEQPFMKRIRLFQIIQGPLIVVLMGMGLTKLLPALGLPDFGLSGAEGQSAWILTQEHLVTIPVPSTAQEFFGQFTLPDFTAIVNPDVWVTAGLIAVVASLETLLSVEATDKLDTEKRVTPTNRELKAQGLGNLISGLIGGLPVTQVIVRSSANIQSGGKTKTSVVFHGLLLLVSIVAFPDILNMIPYASLAAILLLVGYKLCKPSLVKGMWAAGHRQFVPFAVTVVGIVVTNLLVGIALGLAVAIIYILYLNFRTPFYFDPEKHHTGDTIRIELAEDVTFVNKASILKALDLIPDNSKVVIDASRTRSIDADVLEIIEDFKESTQEREIELELIELDVEHSHDPARVFGHSMSSKAAQRSAQS